MEVSVGIRATLDDARLSTQPHTLLTIRHLPKADKDVHPAPPNSSLLPIALSPPWKYRLSRNQKCARQLPTLQRVLTVSVMRAGDSRET